ncbi:MAG: hypothetical protein RBU27_00680 [Bacteroidota bacterium]|nr:hypothetical protein [Bacteroidota bacterium]
MKQISFLFAIALLVVAVSGSAFAQDKPGNKDAKAAVTQSGQQTPGPRFIDEDNDGICDHQKDGTARQRQGARQGAGKGAGQGAGDCTGTAQRQRLRDGSCGDGGATPAGVQRRGRAQAK